MGNASSTDLYHSLTPHRVAMPTFFENAKGFKVGRMEMQNVEGNYTDYGHEETYEEHVGPVVYEQTHAVGVANGQSEFSGTINYGGKKGNGKKQQTRAKASRSQTAPPQTAPQRARQEAKGYRPPGQTRDPPNRGPPRPNLPDRAATYFANAEDFETEDMKIKNVAGDYTNRRTAAVRKTHVQEKRYNQQHAVGVTNDCGRFTGTLNYDQDSEDDSEDEGPEDDDCDAYNYGGYPPPNNGGPDNGGYSDDGEPLIELDQPSPAPISNRGTRNAPQQRGHRGPAYTVHDERPGPAPQQNQPVAARRRQEGAQPPSPFEDYDRTYRSSPGPWDRQRRPRSPPQPNNRQGAQECSPHPDDRHRRGTLPDDDDEECAGIQTPPLTPGRQPERNRAQGGSERRGYEDSARAPRMRAPDVDRDLDGLSGQMGKMSVKNPEAYYASPPPTGTRYRDDTPQYF